MVEQLHSLVKKSHYMGLNPGLKNSHKNRHSKELVGLSLNGLRIKNSINELIVQKEGHNGIYKVHN